MLAAAIVFVLGATAAIVLVRTTISRNAASFATQLARSYAAEEQSRLSGYELYCSYGASSVENLIVTRTDPQRIANWIQNFGSNASETLEGTEIAPYALIDGAVYRSGRVGVRDSYDFASTSWYQEAVASPGTLIATDAYLDATTQRPVITFAQTIGNTDDVFDVDVDLARLGTAMDPDNEYDFSYYLFDSAGNLLSASTRLDVTTSDAQGYLTELRAEVLADTSQDQTVIADASGGNRFAYHLEFGNGWLSVVTVPVKSVLTNVTDGELVTFFGVSITVFAILLLGAIVNYIRTRRIKEVNDTLMILGDTFFAIYRINVDTGRYTTIKALADVADDVGRSGTYEHFLDVMKAVVEPDTWERFRESFSPEHIRRLIDDHVEEFGGEFKRRFGTETRWVSVRVITSPVLVDNEVVLSFRLVDDETRESRQRIDLLRTSLETAEKAARRRTELLGNISHDMRTPLNAVVGMTRLAKESDDSRQVAHYLDLVEDAGEQLQALVEDILELAQAEQLNKGVIKPAPLDLARCVARASVAFTESAERQDKQLEVHVDELPGKVMADKRRIRQVLNNLVSNALKYSHPGTHVDVKLELIEDRRERDGSILCRLVVADDGIGMSEEFLPRIFDPFEREKVFAPRGVTGSGLGMPIVRSLVQQMDGEISVESKLGEGTVFTLDIPFKMASEDGADATDTARGGTEDPASASRNGSGSPLETGQAIEPNGSRREPGGADAPQAQPSADLAGRRVLVAEDNETNAIIDRALLGSLGIEVEVVPDGKEALECFSATEPGTFDAILMDMQMPVMDGCEATRRIRALERADASLIPIIALTASAFEDDQDRARRAGMDGLVTKPIDVAALSRALGAAMRADRSN